MDGGEWIKTKKLILFLAPLKEIVKPTSQIKIAQSQLNTTTNSHSLNPPPSKIICVDLTIDSDDDDDNDKINPSTNYNKNNETNLIRFDQSIYIID